MKLASQKLYSLVAGGILFLIGIFGFVFNSINIPGGYLLLFLVLGFWGIVVGFLS